MSLRTETRAVWHLYQQLRRRTRLLDRLGFGYSRTFTDTTPAVIPDGIDLHFFTGRTRQEETR
jgi:hypothetical protein